MTPSRTNETKETLVEPSVYPKEPHVESVFETHIEPLTFQRQETPSPIRESFLEETHTIDGLHFSPDRPNEAYNSPGHPADEAEDPVTLTNVFALLNRYVKKVDDLEKELKDIKTTLGGKIDVLTEKVQTLEGQHGQKTKRRMVIESEDELHFDSLNVLADATLPQQPPSSPAPTTADIVKPKGPIIYHRKQPITNISKGSKVSITDQNLGLQTDLEDHPSDTSMDVDSAGVEKVSPVQDTDLEAYATIFVAR